MIGQKNKEGKVAIQSSSWSALWEGAKMYCPGKKKKRGCSEEGEGFSTVGSEPTEKKEIPIFKTGGKDLQALPWGGRERSPS